MPGRAVVSPFGAGPKAPTNFTDPESRMMRNGDQAFIEGYNAYVAVDSADSQTTGAVTVTNQAADSVDRLPGLDPLRSNTGRTPQGVLQDAGYGSERKLDGCAERPIPAAIPLETLTHCVGRTDPRASGRIPAHLPRKGRMRRYPRKQAGRCRCRRRPCSVESAMGISRRCKGGESFCCGASRGWTRNDGFTGRSRTWCGCCSKRTD